MWWRDKLERFDRSTAKTIIQKNNKQQLLRESLLICDVKELSEEIRLALLCYYDDAINNKISLELPQDVVLSNHKWLTMSLNDKQIDSTWSKKYQRFIEQEDLDIYVPKHMLRGLLNRLEYEQLTEQQQLLVMFYRLDDYLNCEFDDPNYYVYEENYHIMTETLNKGISKSKIVIKENIL